MAYNSYEGGHRPPGRDARYARQLQEQYCKGFRGERPAHERRAIIDRAATPGPYVGWGTRDEEGYDRARARRSWTDEYVSPRTLARERARQTAASYGTRGVPSVPEASSTSHDDGCFGVVLAGLVFAAALLGAGGWGLLRLLG
jgi:hypothetical protein